MEFLQFVFRDGWTFFGAAFLLWILMAGIEAIVSAIRGEQ